MLKFFMRYRTGRCLIPRSQTPNLGVITLVARL